MRGCLDWALGNHGLVGIVLGNEGVPFSKLAGGGGGTKAPATFKGFDHAADAAIPVSPVWFDIVWPWVIAICGIVKGFEGAGGRVRRVGEKIVIEVVLCGRTPYLSFEDVAAEIARRGKEGILPKFVHSHSAKERFRKGIRVRTI